MSDPRPEDRQLAQPRRPVGVESGLDLLLADVDKLRDFPVENLERIVAMAREERDYDARRSYNLAFRDVQAELDPVVKDAWNDHTKSYYAKVANILASVDPIAQRHGFSRSISTTDCPIQGWMRFVMTLRHVDGHTEEHTFDAPPDGQGAKGGSVMNPVQGAKSAYTYAEGALVQKVWGIQLAEADDDGNTAGGTHVVPISVKQARTLREMIEKAGADPHRFLAYYKIDAVEKLPKASFNDAVSNLNAKMAQAAEAEAAAAQQTLATDEAVEVEAEEVEPEGEPERIVCKGISLGQDADGKTIYGALAPKPVTVGTKVMVAKRDGGWFPRKVAEIVETDSRGYTKVRTEPWPKEGTDG